MRQEVIGTTSLRVRRTLRVLSGSLGLEEPKSDLMGFGVTLRFTFSCGPGCELQGV